jgi:asparagine synthase (glutamine-hydrolysing)
MAEFLLRLPEHYLLGPDGQSKHVFRAAMRGIVPDAILDRRDKVGFQTPERDLLSLLKKTGNEFLVGDTPPFFLKVDECNRAISHMLTSDRYYKPVVWRLMNYWRWFLLSKDYL